LLQSSGVSKYWNNPKWILTRDNHAEAWSQRIPKISKIYAHCIAIADLNVNGSDYEFDFMLFDKPVINTVFGSLENGFIMINDFKYDHYKSD
jgi:hypothetical protein